MIFLTGCGFLLLGSFKMQNNDFQSKKINAQLQYHADTLIIAINLVKTNNAFSIKML